MRCAVQCSAVQCSAVQCSAVQFFQPQKMDINILEKIESKIMRRITQGIKYCSQISLNIHCTSANRETLFT